MAKLKTHNLVPVFVAVAIASASLLISVQSANAARALFRAQQVWWFSASLAQTWTDHQIWPTTGNATGTIMKGTVYLPPASLSVGPTTANATHPKFTVPYAFIKNTTYTFMCGPENKTFKCYKGYPNSSGFYSYWNQEGNFKPDNPYAATVTTTIRQRTVMDDFITSTSNGAGHWASSPHQFGPSGMQKSISLPTHPPTAMYTFETPTEGGCAIGNPVSITAKAQCPGTTQFAGAYGHDRPGSLMIFPGSKRFGGTMRWFDGPNAKFRQIIHLTMNAPYTLVDFVPLPISQQLQGSVPMTIGQVTPTTGAQRVRLTNTLSPPTMKLVTDGQNGTCPSGVTAPPNHGTACGYYVKSVRYINTRGPYTTGKVVAWNPFGNTNTVQTASGYDNRTAMGLSGTISLVRPGLAHSYVSFPSSFPTIIDTTTMVWGSARLKMMKYMFLPEPSGIAMLAAGFTALAGLYRLRRR